MQNHMKTLLKQNKPLLKEFVKWSNLFYLRNDEFYDRDFEHGLAFIVNEISKSNPESWKKEIYDLMRKAVELPNGLYKNFLVSKAFDLESKKLRYNEPTSIKTAINRDEFYEDRQVRLQQNQFSIEQGVPVDTSFSIVDPFIPEWCNIICKPDHFYNLEFLEKSVKQIFKDKKLLETKPKAKMLQNIHELYSRHSFNPESNYWQTMRGIIELFVMSIEEESFVSKFDQINLLQQQYLILDNCMVEKINVLDQFVPSPVIKDMISCYHSSLKEEVSTQIMVKGIVPLHDHNKKIEFVRLSNCY